MDYDIDFVVPWVDGSDSEWIKEFNKYAPKEKQRNLDVSDERFRDWGLLKYWFRGVEKYAPWVNKVHFITCGQKPDWLNENCPKLNWIKHEDYMPNDSLPVFSSHPIEICMNRIEGLSEHFVYFNDDFYLTGPVNKDFFFKNGLPCDSACMNAFSYWNIIGIIAQNIGIINKEFNKKQVLKKNIWKWYNPKYGSFLIRNIFLSLWSNFTFFYDTHMAQPYLKSTLEEVWTKYGDKLEETLYSKFRNDRDVNQWVFRYWQLCKGNFYPISPVKGKRKFVLYEDIEKICNSILDPHIKEVVLNDTLEDALTQEEYEFKMMKIQEAFEKILPEKSSFEK